MWTRRRFLTQSLALVGATGTALAFPGDVQEGAIPDGSASRGMITAETEQAIENGLKYLRSQQSSSGAFGTNNYRGNVAVSSLGGLAFMAGGHQPGRGAHGKVVTE